MARFGGPVFPAAMFHLDASGTAIPSKGEIIFEGEIMAKNDDWYLGNRVNETPKEEKDLLVESARHEKHDCYLTKLSGEMQDALYAIHQYAKEHGFTGKETREIFTAGITTIARAHKFSPSVIEKIKTTIHLWNITVPDAQSFSGKQCETTIQRRLTGRVIFGDSRKVAGRIGNDASGDPKSVTGTMTEAKDNSRGGILPPGQTYTV